MKNWFPIIILFFISCNSANDDDVEVDISSCPPVEIVKRTVFDSNDLQEFELVSHTLTRNTLKITMKVRGCNFQRNFRLLISEEKSKSNPPQQDVKLIFTEQNCNSLFDLTICFDVSSIDRPAVLKFPHDNGVTEIELF